MEEHPTTIPSVLMPDDFPSLPDRAHNSHPVLKTLVAVVLLLVAFVLFKRASL